LTAGESKSILSFFVFLLIGMTPMGKTTRDESPSARICGQREDKSPETERSERDIDE
jgi:hypothetical protein